MNIYRFDVDTTSKGSFIDESPIRPDGKGLRREQLNSPPCRLDEVEVDVDQLSDVIWTMATLLFGEQARKCVLRHKLHEGLGWVPVEVADRSGKSVTYWALMAGHRVKVLDIDRANVTWLVPDKVLGAVGKWIVKGNKLPDCDLFEADSGVFLVTENLRQEFAMAGVTGAIFYPCEVSWEDCN